MRPDVKLGVVFSLVVVLGVGGYFLLRGKREPAIAITATPAANSAKTTIPTGKIDRTATGKPQTNTPKTKAESVTIPPAARTADAAGGGAASPQPANPGPAAAPVTGIASTMNPSTSIPAAATTSTPGSPAPTALTSTRSPHAAPHVGMSSAPAIPPQTLEQMAAGSSIPGAPVASSSVPAAKPDGPSAMPHATSPAITRSAPPASPFSSQPTTVVSTAPTSNPVKTDNAATETHRVQSGDSIASLARRYYGSERHVDHLLKANPQIKDPARLSIGMTVTIPAEPQAVAAAPVTDSKGEKPVSLETRIAAGDKSGTSSRTYQVKPGDSFYAIARDILGDANRWNEILAMNREKVDGNPNRLRVGQVLVLPGA